MFCIMRGKGYISGIVMVFGALLIAVSLSGCGNRVVWEGEKKTERDEWLRVVYTQQIVEQPTFLFWDYGERKISTRTVDKPTLLGRAAALPRQSYEVGKGAWQVGSATWDVYSPFGKLKWLKGLSQGSKASKTATQIKAVNPSPQKVGVPIKHPKNAGTEKP